jgi:hypothetical protein
MSDAYLVVVLVILISVVVALWSRLQTHEARLDDLAKRLAKLDGTPWYGD